MAVFNQKGVYVNNVIKEFLDLKECNDIRIGEVRIDDLKLTKVIPIEKIKGPVFCPVCKERMYSKGFYVRKVNHPVLADGYKVILEVRQRKYRCTNKDCNTYMNEDFSFVERYKHNSYITPYLALQDLKDITVTVAYVARKRNVSETWVHDVVMTYLRFERLPLCEVLCIDEVYLDICKDARYCVILRDFMTGDIIDILPNRYKKTFDDYFYHIPRQERKKVKFIISDMYEPYLKMNENYFPEAVSVIDSFHVIQWINNKINLFINEVKKQYQKKDDERRKELNYRENRDFIRRKDSKEVYLLKNHRWVLLQNDDNISYDPYRHLNRKLGSYVNTKDIYDQFMALNPDFPVIKKLKEKYIRFNNEYMGKKQEAEKGLDDLIKEYGSSSYPMFRDFALILEKRRNEILASFTRLDIKADQEKTQEFYRRMSNGPMEGFNRKPKDMKRLGRGYFNFDFIRNRILWSAREDAHILGSPIPVKEIKEKYRTGKKRGKYNKNNKKQRDDRI